MIVEERIYTAHVGRAKEWLDYYGEAGFPVQQRHLGRCIGFFTTEIGPLNQIIHMWGYEDLVDRAKRRAELMADPGFQAFGAKIQPLILTMENKILIPTAFSPIR